MKELVITVARQKRELLILLACFLGAIGLNFIGIVKYNTAWKELYTQWFTLLLLTVVLYFLVLLFRLLIILVIRPFRRNKNQ